MAARPRVRPSPRTFVSVVGGSVWAVTLVEVVAHLRVMSTYPLEADIHQHRWHVRFGSLATEPFSASSDQCPLLSNNGQNVAVPRLSAKCQ
jgi:hypothetical protein